MLKSKGENLIEVQKEVNWGKTKICFIWTTAKQATAHACQDGGSEVLVLRIPWGILISFSLALTNW